ncbi:FAD dependent oxidoreductase [Podospora fimiseda]|uniref:FAD dependent oxidoreductase n=1 Tax=Podospora fimiseda TaxID=252190 RepID=A0AAN6YMW0_9PEZI|nr:FAD dependent oxidoreductase [Podospora fimiseda]
MPTITILGAGITALSTAYTLPKSHRLKILASNLPGDLPSSQNWASPHACAGWVALGGLSPLEQQMQLDSLHFLRQLSLANPESGVRTALLTDIHEDPPVNGIWYKNRVPGYTESLNKDGGITTKYESLVIDPSKFLVWLRTELEKQGTVFERVEKVESLSELSGVATDVVINASGLGSRELIDVKDENVVGDRTYTVRVETEFKEMFVRRGKGGKYTYVFGRGDGTAVLGGISVPVEEEVKGLEEVRGEIIGRVHENLPEYFPSADPKEYNVLEDLVGIRPLRFAGVRVEKEMIGDQKVVHAYGTTIGGYIHSFGLARQVAKLVDDFVFEL